MEERPFTNPTVRPSENELLNVLGNSAVYYLEMNEIARDFKQKWNFSKGSGWIQKVFDTKKALFYFIPLKDGFKISLTIREQEKIKFLRDPELKIISNQIINSKKYSEGYAILFEISEASTFSIFKVFLNKLIGERILKNNFNKLQP